MGVFGAFPALLFVLALAAAVCSSNNVSASRDCFQPTAAFTYDQEFYIVSGNDYVKLNSSSYWEYATGTIKDKFGIDGDIDAAFIIRPGPDYILNFVVGQQVFQFIPGTNTVPRPFPIGYLRPFFPHGLDAASEMGDESYVFIGCHYSNFATVGKLADIGLPCNVDAAFQYRSGSMLVIKGDNLWELDARRNNKVAKGPMKLTELFTLTSTSLCQPLTYDEKVKAERSYEAENKCVILDAAVTYGDSIFLFNDNEYVTIDGRNLNEVGGKNVLEGVSVDRVDAEVVFPGNGITYMFTGTNYYRYVDGNILGPSNAAELSPFLEHGVDAAGTINGVTYFFKDCEVTRNQGEPVNLRDNGLPCNVDAAFSQPDGIYVVKGNHVWAWLGEGTDPIPIKDLSDLFHMSSWAICHV